MKISQLSFEKHEIIKNNNIIIFYDYVIDNKTLKDILNKQLKSSSNLFIDYKNLIPPFGFLSEDQKKRIINQLLLQEHSDFKPGRIPLYLCSECGSYDCGAVTVEIIQDKDTIIWQNFALEYNYNEDIFYFNENNHLKFCFTEELYYKIILKHLR